MNLQQCVIADYRLLQILSTFYSRAYKEYEKNGFMFVDLDEYQQNNKTIMLFDSQKHRVGRIDKLEIAITVIDQSKLE